MDSRATEHNDPRASLALWLRTARAERQLSLSQVAKVTKIQPRILEKLENGELEGLPAEVFVRGFIRSFAKCVGLNESEALDRYGECKRAQVEAPAAAKAFVQTMVARKPARQTSGLRPQASGSEPPPAAEPVAAAEPVTAATPVAETVALALTESVLVTDAVVVPETVAVAAADPVTVPVEVATAVVEAPAKKKRTRKLAAGTTPPPTRARRQGKKKDTVEAVSAEGTGPIAARRPITINLLPPAPVVVVESSSTEIDTDFDLDITVTAPWTPTMPPMPAPSVPWRRASFTTTTAASSAAPSLVIDDADPDRAEREQTSRSKDHRVSFLPPILLDRDDRSQRQGGLTLAVIILLIAATLTLSYLMRRPTVSGDGVTMNDTPATLA